MKEKLQFSVTCVYCGHEYPRDAPSYGDPVLTDHIKTCEKHPMRGVVADRDRLRAALVGVIGADGKDELHQLEVAIRSLPQCDVDKAVALNAVHALIATLPEAA